MQYVKFNSLKAIQRGMLGRHHVLPTCQDPYPLVSSP